MQYKHTVNQRLKYIGLHKAQKNRQTDRHTNTNAGTDTQIFFWEFLVHARMHKYAHMHTQITHIHAHACTDT